jgi:hypothetical protein
MQMDAMRLGVEIMRGFVTSYRHTTKIIMGPSSR